MFIILSMFACFTGWECVICLSNIQVHNAKETSMNKIVSSKNLYIFVKYTDLQGD